MPKTCLPHFRFHENGFRSESVCRKHVLQRFRFHANRFRNVSVCRKHVCHISGFTKMDFVANPFAANTFCNVSGFTQTDFVTFPFAANTFHNQRLRFHEKISAHPGLFLHLLGVEVCVFQSSTPGSFRITCVLTQHTSVFGARVRARVVREFVREWCASSCANYARVCARKK